MNLKGKTAVVTGGGRDIGRACVMRLAKAGANVAINYHSSSHGADSAVEEIKANGGSAFALQGDMTDPAHVAAFIDATVAQYGRIEVVVPVTGGMVARKTMAEMTLEHWQSVMDLNLTSLFHTVKAALPHMPKGSAIVNAVCPGMINTDFHAVFTRAEVRKSVASATPLKREGDAEDVANLVTYLASDEAAFVTGACVDINGGMLFS